jgi:hypothetical protein
VSICFKKVRQLLYFCYKKEVDLLSLFETNNYAPS